jgi:hypothetical protein
MDTIVDNSCIDVVPNHGYDDDDGDDAACVPMRTYNTIFKKFLLYQKI